MKTYSIHTRVNHMFVLNVAVILFIGVLYKGLKVTVLRGEGLVETSVFVLLMVGFLVFQYVLTRRLIGRLAEPLNEFEEALEDIRKGNYKKRVQPSGIVEINAVAQNINFLLDYFSRFMGYIQQVAAGNLNVNVLQNGLLSKSFEQMIHNYRDVLDKIAQSAQEVNAITDQVSAATQQLSSGINEQAGTSEEIVASVEEMEKTAANIAATSQKLKDSYDRMFALIENGRQLLITHRNEMETSRSLTAQNREKVGQLSEDIHNITQILAHISDIATETKMLALNASIEALKAGDSGKGFSAVAMEIRKLAENALQFTQDVHAVISKTTYSAQEVEEVSRDVERKIEETFQQSEEIDKKFTRIDEEGRELIELGDFLSEAASQQQVVTKQITTAIKETSIVLRESAKSSTDIAHSTEQLKYHVRRYKDILNFYVTTEERAGNEVVQN